jgi:hypothetical protein
VGLKTLDQICIEMGADKASQHHVRGHDYARHYDQLFSLVRKDPLRLLEIGVGGGESIMSWLEYFPNALVFGVDIVSNTNPWNTPDAKADPRYKFLQGNQSDPTMWKCLFANWGGYFDIVIDDGSHMSGDVQTTFPILWPAVTDGGIYCIEDTGVTYTTSTIFHTPGFPTHSSWIKALVEQTNRGSEHFDAMFVFEELVALIKK